MKYYKSILIGNMMKNKRLIFLIISLLAAIVIGIILNIPEPPEPYRDMTMVEIMEGYSVPRYRAESKDPKVQASIKEMVARRKSINNQKSRPRHKPAINYPYQVIQKYKHDEEVLRKKFVGVTFDSITVQDGMGGEKTYKNGRIRKWHSSHVRIYYDLKIRNGIEIYKLKKVDYSRVDAKTRTILGFNKELYDRFLLYRMQLNEGTFRH